MRNDEIQIQGDRYIFISDYRGQDTSRKSLNRLTRETYGFDFEKWYQDGYWGDSYIPCSLLHNGEVVANVSVNPIDFLVDGKPFRTIQIGTVMTAEAYRRKGLSRELINRILADYKEGYDLMYLYANDTVLDFYPKFGFHRDKEYLHTKLLTKDDYRGELSLRRLSMNRQEDRDLLYRLVSETVPVSRISMLGNPGLRMFYLTSFMAENIYYSEKLDLAAVAEYDGENIYLQDIYSRKEFDLKFILGALMKESSRKAVLGFTPWDSSGFLCEELKEEGTTFFLRGQNPLGKGRFPLLSHA